MVLTRFRAERNRKSPQPEPGAVAFIDRAFAQGRGSEAEELKTIEQASRKQRRARSLN